MASKLPGQRFFSNAIDPLTVAIDPLTIRSPLDAGPLRNRLVGPERAPTFGDFIMTVVSNNNSDISLSPPEGRLWATSDLALYFGVKSVGELIKRHPDFPSPLPLRTRDRRWRSCDVIAWTNSLVTSPVSNEGYSEIPEFDITSISGLKEA